LARRTDPLFTRGISASSTASDFGLQASGTAPATA
jgi:hypothetical protein